MVAIYIEIGSCRAHPLIGEGIRAARLHKNPGASAMGNEQS